MDATKLSCFTVGKNARFGVGISAPAFADKRRAYVKRHNKCYDLRGTRNDHGIGGTRRWTETKSSRVSGQYRPWPEQEQKCSLGTLSHNEPAKDETALSPTHRDAELPVAVCAKHQCARMLAAIAPTFGEAATTNSCSGLILILSQSPVTAFPIGAKKIDRC